jgi:hypothetical protein
MNIEFMGTANELCRHLDRELLSYNKAIINNTTDHNNIHRSHYIHTHIVVCYKRPLQNHYNNFSFCFNFVVFSKHYYLSHLILIFKPIIMLLANPQSQYCR